MIRRKLVWEILKNLLTVPFMSIVNVILSKMIGESVFDIWDMLSAFIFLILAFVAFICDCVRKRA